MGRWRTVGKALALGALVAGCSGSPSAARHPRAAPARPPTSSTTVPSGGESTSPSSTAGSPTAPDTAIEVYGDCQHPSVEPSEIVLTCADDAVQAEGLTWSQWSAAGATAVGTLVYNDCVPDCAAGTFRHIDDDLITLSDPVRTATGVVVWSRIQESPEPPGYQTGPYHGGPQPLPTRPDSSNDKEAG